MKPFDKEKASQYFIVAWVKNWKIYTYIQAIGVGDVAYDKIYDVYSWMPDAKNKHYYFNGDVRAWCALAMRSINDKLWDTDDNAKRLALAKRIENWDSAGVKQSARHIKDVQEHTIDRRKARLTGLGHKVSVETMRRGNGHHWGVVK
jgi:hypothetical protein